MLDIRLWQHKTSGEIYAVRYSVAADGECVHVQQAAGPFHYSELDAARCGDWDDEIGLAQYIDQHQFDYRELEQPHRGVLQADLE
jgi:hypothetical protein